jgi:hypothetical protein
MRFSTTNSASMAHSATNPSISINFKKVFSTLFKHHQKVTPVVHTPVIIPKSTAITKDDDIYRDLRKYYSNHVPKKRQLDELVVTERKSLERETRHKTVKQYQQPSERKYHHWKESSSPSFDINKAAPTAFKTHGYVRDTRSNSNHLRILAITNNASNKIMSKEKQFIQKRKDEFVWGSKSKLRQVSTIN